MILNVAVKLVTKTTTKHLNFSICPLKFEVIAKKQKCSNLNDAFCIRVIYPGVDKNSKTS